MVNYFITSNHLSILLVPIVLFGLKNFDLIKKYPLYYSPLLLLLSIYSVASELNFSVKITLNIVICTIAGLISLGVYKQVIPLVSKTALKQKKRALKKIPLLIIVLFFTLSNFLSVPLSFGMLAVGLVLVERSYRVALFSWPFVIINFVDYSVIMEGLIIFSQSVAIFMLKEKND